MLAFSIVSWSFRMPSHRKVTWYFSEECQILPSLKTFWVDQFSDVATTRFCMIFNCLKEHYIWLQNIISKEITCARMHLNLILYNITSFAHYVTGSKARTWRMGEEGCHIFYSVSLLFIVYKTGSLPSVMFTSQTNILIHHWNPNLNQVEDWILIWINV